MAIVWGVETTLVEVPQSTDAEIKAAIDEFLALKRLKLGELVIITAGVPVGVAGNTNMILTQTV